MSSQALNFPPGSSALVTGATGFTGVQLTRKLCAAGVKVRAIVRPSSNLGELAELPIEWFRGQVYDAALIEKAAEGVDYIFHVAAAYREAKIKDVDYTNVHIVSTKHLFNAIKGRANFKRFIHISTVGVHGHIEHPPANEEAPFAPGDIYQETKAEAELWLREACAKAQVPFTVIRPAAIYGPGDRRLLKIFKLAQAPLFPILGFGKCLYHLIHVQDLTNIIALAAVSPSAANEVLICGNRESVTLVQIGGWVAAECGKKLRVVRIPAWPFFLLGGICEAIWKPLGKEPPLYRRRVAFFTKDRSFDTSKLQQKLDYQYTYSNEEGVRQTARWYLENGWM